MLGSQTYHNSCQVAHSSSITIIHWSSLASPAVYILLDEHIKWYKYKFTKVYKTSAVQETSQSYLKKQNESVKHLLEKTSPYLMHNYMG